MAEASDISQFRSPLPNIGYRGGSSGGGGGLGNTTVAHQQLKQFIQSLNESLVENRSLDIKKEIADAEMNVAIGFVSPPTESMKENAHVLEKYSSVLAESYGNEDAGLLLDQAHTLQADAMEGYIYGDTNAKGSPASKLVESFDQWKTSNAEREDRSNRPDLLKRPEYLKALLMAEQKIEGNLRSNVQKESIRQRTLTARSAIKGELEALSFQLKKPQLHNLTGHPEEYHQSSYTLDSPRDPNPKDFKKIYDKLHPNFPLLGSQIEVLIHAEVLSEASSVIANPDSGTNDRFAALALGMALDDKGYARNGLSLTSVTEGGTTRSGPSNSVRQLIKQFNGIVSQVDKATIEEHTRSLHLLTDEALKAIPRGVLESYLTSNTISVAASKEIMKRHDGLTEISKIKNRERRGWNAAGLISDDILMLNDTDAHLKPLALNIRKNLDLGSEFEGHVLDFLKARQTLLLKKQADADGRTWTRNYYTALERLPLGTMGAESAIYSMIHSKQLSIAGGKALLAKQGLYTKLRADNKDDAILAIFETDHSSDHLPLGRTGKDAAAWTALLAKYNGYPALKTALVERRKELREYKKFQETKAEVDALKNRQDANFSGAMLGGSLIGAITEQNRYAGIDILKGTESKGVGLRGDQEAILKWFVDTHIEASEKKADSTENQKFIDLLENPNLVKETKEGLEGKIIGWSEDHQSQARKWWATLKSQSKEAKDAVNSAIKTELLSNNKISNSLLLSTDLDPNADERNEFQIKYGFTDEEMRAFRDRQAAVKSQGASEERGKVIKKAAYDTYFDLKGNSAKLIHTSVEDLRKTPQLSQHQGLIEKLVNERIRLLEADFTGKASDKKLKKTSEEKLAAYMSHSNRQAVIDGTITIETHPDLFLDEAVLLKAYAHEAATKDREAKRIVDEEKGIADLFAAHPAILQHYDLNLLRKRADGTVTGLFHEDSTEYKKLVQQQKLLKLKDEHILQPAAARMLHYSLGSNILRFKVDPDTGLPIDKADEKLTYEQVASLITARETRKAANKEEERVYNYNMWIDNSDLKDLTERHINTLTGRFSKQTSELLAKRIFYIHDAQKTDDQQNYLADIESFLTNPELFRVALDPDVKEAGFHPQVMTPEQLNVRLKYEGEGPPTAHMSARKLSVIEAYETHKKFLTTSGTQAEIKNFTIITASLVHDPGATIFRLNELKERIAAAYSLPNGSGIDTKTFNALTDDIEARKTEIRGLLPEYKLWRARTYPIFREYIYTPPADSPAWAMIRDTNSKHQLIQLNAKYSKLFSDHLQTKFLEREKAIREDETGKTLRYKTIDVDNLARDFFLESNSKIKDGKGGYLTQEEAFTHEIGPLAKNLYEDILEDAKKKGGQAQAEVPIVNEGAAVAGSTSSTLNLIDRTLTPTITPTLEPEPTDASYLDAILNWSKASYEAMFESEPSPDEEAEILAREDQTFIHGDFDYNIGAPKVNP